MMITALAPAAQPDHAMAGVLVAGVVALVLVRPNRHPVMALAAAAPAFSWTLLMPDALPAVPYVDRILYAAFDVHPLAGLAVMVGAALLVVPAVIGASLVADSRPVILAFGDCWAAVVIAAAFGNYPTPLVGYGGSAVLGYLLSAAVLPTRADERGRDKATGLDSAVGRGSDRTTSELRAAVIA